MEGSDEIEVDYDQAYKYFETAAGLVGGSKHMPPIPLLSDSIFRKMGTVTVVWGSSTWKAKEW